MNLLPFKSYQLKFVSCKGTTQENTKVIRITTDWSTVYHNLHIFGFRGSTEMTSLIFKVDLLYHSSKGFYCLFGMFILVIICTLYSERESKVALFKM
jgi:hypothetical protein